MLKYIFSISTLLLVTIAVANNTKQASPDTPLSVTALLHEYDYINGEIDALLHRADMLEADIDTTATDLTKFDAMLGEVSDSMIQLRRTCGEYLVMARKARKMSPSLPSPGSRDMVYSSIRRNGYITADIFRARKDLRDLNDRYFKIYNEKERIKYLIDHESDLYAMYDNILDRIDMLDLHSKDVTVLINPYRDQAEAYLMTRNANAAHLDNELASAYVVRIDRNKKKAQPGTDDRQNDESPVPDDGSYTPQADSEFGRQQGQLMFPVSGRYNIVSLFGTYPHPLFSNITVNNPGIDIEAGSGSRARAIFPGTVDAIYDIAGFNRVVVLRHGDYYTVYGNLSDTSLKTGAKVKAGQLMGDIASEDGHTILHFEVRLGTEALDPILWVKM